MSGDVSCHVTGKNTGESQIPPVVLLVDNRWRDLNMASLIALHLKHLGVETILETLEAYRAVAAAYRPGMVVFNHLYASHLVACSKQLAEMGVLTAVLSNEGMYLKEDDLQFNSGRYHGGGHLDHFFCWNTVHKNALVAEGAYKGVQIDVVGVPRFDFYFEPWSHAIAQPARKAGVRPQILACTNFGLAKFWDLPRDKGDNFFRGWAQRLPLYQDYWNAIESQWNSQRRLLEYLKPLIDSKEYDIVLRPHPSEKADVYEKWLNNLCSSDRERVRIDAQSNISSLILSCDLELSGESCTTAVESWIAKKPNIELVFDRHPMLYSEERSRGNVHCDDPTKIVGLVKQQLTRPVSSELQDIRQAYLAHWCNSPDGNACRRIAEIAAAAVKSKQPADWSKLTINDYRRAAKLKAYRALGQAYHFDPLLPIKRRLFADRYTLKQWVYDKSIKPRDVQAAQLLIEQTANFTGV
jgi:surface carbohydrate biosynthesis protein